MNTEKIAPALVFETAPCGRCGGTGRLPEFSHVAGGVCAKCSGTKLQLSRRGARAKRLYDALLLERAGRKTAEVKVGDVIITTWGLEPVEDITVEANAKWGDTVWFHRGGGKVGTTWSQLHRLYLPEVIAEVAAEVAQRCAGASLPPAAA